MDVIYGALALLAGIAVWFLLQLVVWSAVVRTAEQANRCMALVGAVALGAPLLVIIVTAIRFASGQKLGIGDFVVMPVITATIFLTSLGSLAVIKRRKIK